METYPILLAGMGKQKIVRRVIGNMFEGHKFFDLSPLGVPSKEDIVTAAKTCGSLLFLPFGVTAVEFASETMVAIQNTAPKEMWKSDRVYGASPNLLWLFVRHREDPKRIMCWSFMSNDGEMGLGFSFDVEYNAELGKIIAFPEVRHPFHSVASETLLYPLAAEVLWALAMINHPRTVVVRRQHKTPEERRLYRGTNSYNGYSEIVLRKRQYRDVLKGPPTDRRHQEHPVRAHLTHLDHRPRSWDINGWSPCNCPDFPDGYWHKQLDEHTRGDPSLGSKVSRYFVEG